MQPTIDSGLACGNQLAKSTMKCWPMKCIDQMLTEPFAGKSSLLESTEGQAQGASAPEPVPSHASKAPACGNSKLFPVPAGAALLRDAFTMAAATRWLPNQAPPPVGIISQLGPLLNATPATDLLPTPRCPETPSLDGHGSPGSRNFPIPSLAATPQRWFQRARTCKGANSLSIHHSFAKLDDFFVHTINRHTPGGARPLRERSRHFSGFVHA